MTPDLKRLREAGARLRARPVAITLDALAELLDRFAAASSAERDSLLRSLPQATGFASETVRIGLERGFAPLTGAALRALVDAELGGSDALDAGRVCGFDWTSVVLAGAIPMPTLLSIVPPLVLRSPVCVKTARHDPLTAARVVDALREIDPLLGACVELIPSDPADRAWTETLLRADCVVVNGSDETVERLRRGTPATARFVAYGHRVSLAVVGTEATRGPALEQLGSALALDVALWDQLGCLSPIALFVCDEAAEACDRVADALAAALEAAQSRWPRGRIDAAAAAHLEHERAEAQMRAAAGRGVRVLAGQAGEWTVVREVDAWPRPAPLHRFVRVHPAAAGRGALSRALAEALGPYARQLAGVALAGFGARNDEAARSCAALGASRVCAAGELQSPPLAWPRDAHPVLLSLARLALLQSPSG